MNLCMKNDQILARLNFSSSGPMSSSSLILPHLTDCLAHNRHTEHLKKRTQIDKQYVLKYSSIKIF